MVTTLKVLSSFKAMNHSMNALIAGASGIIGRAAARALTGHGGSVKGIARHPIPGLDTVKSDLRDREATFQAIKDKATEITHLFYAALAPHPNLSVEVKPNKMPKCSIIWSAP